MSLQDTFYIVAIIALCLYAILLLVLIFVLLFLKKKISDMHTLFETNFTHIKELVSDPGSIVANVGSTMAGKVVSKAAEFLGLMINRVDIIKRSP